MLKSWLQKVFATVVLLLSLFAVLGSSVSAATHNDVITGFRVVDKDDNLLQDTVEMWNNFKIIGDFKLPDTGVQEGDTTRFLLPETIVYTSPNQTFDLKAPDGTIVAQASVNPDTREVLITYTNYASLHSGITGSFFFEARINHVLVQNPGPVVLTFDMGGTTLSSNPVPYAGVQVPTALPLVKSAWPTTNDPQSISYYIAINRSRDTASNVTFTDQLRNVDGGKIDLNTIEIYKGSWSYDPATVDFRLDGSTEVTNQFRPLISQSPDGKTVTIPFGDLTPDEGYVLLYQVKLDYEPVHGEVFVNQAALEGDNGYRHTSQADATYNQAGGLAGGYNYTIQIQKADEAGNPLANAKFDVIRKANNQKVGELITDANGSAQLTNLLRTEYLIKETEAPSGYQLLTTPIEIAVGDFGTNNIAVKTIVNSLQTPLTRTISVVKRWEDVSNKDNRRPQEITIRLFKVLNGLETEVASKQLSEADRQDDNTWVSDFTNLPTHEAGQEIEYVIREDAVAGYTSTVTDYTVTNTYRPQSRPSNSSNNTTSSQSSSTSSSSSTTSQGNTTSSQSKAQVNTANLTNNTATSSGKAVAGNQRSLPATGTRLGYIAYLIAFLVLLAQIILIREVNKN